MAINKLISIKIPVLHAADDMGIDLTRDKPTFTKWAVRAEKDIGSYYSYKRKRYVLDIVGCHAELPSCAAYLKAAVLGDHGCECDELFSSLYLWASTITAGASDVFLLVDKPDPNDFCVGNISWEVQDNNVVFNRNLDGQKVTVECLCLEEDCDGFAMVNENHVPAIIEFIMWRFAVRSRFSQNKMDHGDVKYHENEYFRLCSDARAEDNTLTDSQRAEIVAMLHDPFSGYGLEIGSLNNNNLW